MRIITSTTYIYMEIDFFFLNQAPSIICVCLKNYISKLCTFNLLKDKNNCVKNAQNVVKNY